MSRTIVAAFAAILAATPAAATQLINQDSVSYNIEVTSEAGSIQATINGQTTEVVCSSSSENCKIMVEGIGEIVVSGAQDVVIENGTLTKKERTGN